MTDISALILFFLWVKIVAIYALLVCKIFSLDIRPRNFFLTHIMSVRNIKSWVEYVLIHGGILFISEVDICLSKSIIINNDTNVNIILMIIKRNGWEFIKRTEGGDHKRNHLNLESCWKVSFDDRLKLMNIQLNPIWEEIKILKGRFGDQSEEKANFCLSSSLL